MRQLSEAQDLKDHVDRREQAVSRVLARCLSPEQHRDYRYDSPLSQCTQIGTHSQQRVTMLFFSVFLSAATL